MKEFWDKRFMEKQYIFGCEPGNIAILCEKIFKENNAKDILIIGIGYGRNGKYFVENGYNVDGMEISDEAINIGKKFAPEINFITGSVLDTNLNRQYDAIFCYDIMQLFRKNERKIITRNCIRHCKENVIIMLSCLSKKDILFGRGNEEEEMKNIDEGLNVMKIGYLTEKTEGEKKRNRIYGIYSIRNENSKNCT
jgi:2-polyprenyl-3-methyl-5-hydroxy-6-metoxy-1,4-benzoquinol methylase